MSVRVGWVFTDPYTSDTVTLEVNPKEADSPQLSRQITYASPAAPGSGFVAQEGRQKPQTMSFTGITLSEDQYNVWITWFSKNTPFDITDDLGRTFRVYVTDFKPKRVRSVNFPWRHEYTVDCMVVNQP